MFVTPISVAKSNGHYVGVMKGLSLIENEILNSLQEKRRILIKPDLSTLENPIGTTHIGAVRAVIDFIYNVSGSQEIILADSSEGDFYETLERLGYLSLQDDYDVNFIDLNKDRYKEVKVFDENLGEELVVRLAETVLESDFKISVCRPKTHNKVIASVTIENMVMGIMRKEDRGKIDVGFKAINMSIAKIGKLVMPALSVVDGYVGVEGNYPEDGRQVDLKVSLSGLNPVSVDSITAWIMGIKPSNIGYLYYLYREGLGEIDPVKMFFVGQAPSTFRRRMQPHTSYQKQLSWKSF